MTVDEDGNEFTCQAGRAADFGGLWASACDLPYSKNQHVLITALGEFVFCEFHMMELIDSGLITDPYVTEDVAVKLAEVEREEMRRGPIHPRPLFGPWKQP